MAGLVVSVWMSGCGVLLPLACEWVGGGASSGARFTFRREQRVLSDP